MGQAQEHHGPQSIKKGWRRMRIGISAKRFWKLVDKTGDCWLWLGRKDSNGYGTFKFRGKWDGAHRIAYILSKGELKNCACHSCDNPSCCKPDHLFDGTRADNNADARKKGRWIPDIEHIRAVGFANKGRRHSEETRKQMSQSRLGKPGIPHTEETKQKLSQLRSGRKFGPLSAEHKAKLSESWKHRRLLPPVIPNEATREKMRQAHVNHPRDLNGKFISFNGGTCV